jgi:hypothetical protein
LFYWYWYWYYWYAISLFITPLLIISILHYWLIFIDIDWLFDDITPLMPLRHWCHWYCHWLLTFHYSIIIDTLLIIIIIAFIIDWYWLLRHAMTLADIFIIITPLHYADIIILLYFDYAILLYLLLLRQISPIDIDIDITYIISLFIYY